VFLAFASRSILWDLIADVYFLLAHVLCLHTALLQRDGTLCTSRKKIWAKWASYAEFEKGERDNSTSPLLCVF
jgi:hypothetical protein